MESNQKTIKINLGDFEVKKGAGTRKRSTNTDSTAERNELRMRSPIRPRKTTVRNNNTLLRFIRRHQEEKRRRLLEEEFHDSEVDVPHLGDVDPIGNIRQDGGENEVDETLNYLMQLAKEVKHGGSVSVGHADTRNNFETNENVSINFPSDSAVLPPPYGILKNSGYNNPIVTNATGIATATSATPSSIYSNVPPMQPPMQSSIQHYPVQESSYSHSIGQYNDVMNQDHYHNQFGGGNGESGGGNSTDYDQEDPEKVRLKYVKQKRTKHRTFKVGKSKDVRNVGVLISNRTIRKGITTKKQLIKQAPIHEIRKYLVKRGLIKVGTTAPNEVLRKMYETSQLMCGELYNHNTDVLLHNFMNDDFR